MGIFRKHRGHLHEAEGVLHVFCPGDAFWIGRKGGKGKGGKGDKGKDKRKEETGKPDRDPFLTEPESEAESEGSATVMAMRFSCPGRGFFEPSSQDRVLSQPEKLKPDPPVVSKRVGPKGLLLGLRIRVLSPWAP